MVSYEKYPGVDDEFNLPPRVRQALAVSKEMRESLSFVIDEAKFQTSPTRIRSTAGMGLRVIRPGQENAIYASPTPTFENYNYPGPCVITFSFSFMWQAGANAAASIRALLDGKVVQDMRIHNHGTGFGEWTSATISGEAFVPSAGIHTFTIRGATDAAGANMAYQDFDGSIWIQDQLVLDLGVAGGGSGQIEVSSSMPIDPSDGDIWWDTVSGQLKVFDATMLSEWVVNGEPPPSIAYSGLALGRGTVGNTYAIAVGADATADGHASIVIGHTANDYANQEVISIGAGAKGQGLRAIAIGSVSSATGPNNVAIGYYSRVGSMHTVNSDSVAIGFDALVTSDDSLGLGRMVRIESNAESSVALGNGAVVKTPTTTSTSAYSTVVGAFSNADGPKTVAVGAYASATNEGTTAIGAHATVSSQKSIAIGQYASASFENQTLLRTKYLELEPAYDSITSDPSTGVILTSPNGTRFVLTVDDTGNLSTTPFTNPV